MEDLHSQRRDYTSRSLTESDLHAHPMSQFAQWIKDARGDAEIDFNAFTLATTGSTGYPQARVVLLKDFDQRGFTFYTNYESDKAEEIEQIPRVGANFFWPELERQVRVHGDILKVSDEENDAYFSSRPKESQIGAWTSDQSREINSRKELDDKYAELELKYRDTDVPRPEHWGGYRILPVYMEFWQGRASRLHDRLVYELKDEDIWTVKRIAP